MQGTGISVTKFCRPSATLVGRSTGGGKGKTKFAADESQEGLFYGEYPHRERKKKGGLG